MKVRKLFIVALALVLSLPFCAEFFCKRYDFTQEKYVKLNQKVGDLEILDLKFELPNQDYQQNRCVVTVKNYGPKMLKVNLAVALFDESGNLVGCGTTGTKLTGTRSGHTETYYVTFDYVRTKIGDTKFFYVTAETAIQ
jgi:hypothetical protein